MKNKEGYPREINKISQILGYAEEHETEEEEEESEENQSQAIDTDEEADSSHYSIGGDNGW